MSGTSIGAINAAILISYVKENKTWEGSDQRLIEFWEYLYRYDNKPLKECLEKFAKFPISTSLEKSEPRRLLVTVDVQDATPVVLDSYEKKDGTSQNTGDTVESSLTVQLKIKRLRHLNMS